MTTFNPALNANTPDVTVVASGGHATRALRLLRQQDAATRILITCNQLDLSTRTLQRFGGRPLRTPDGHLLPDAITVTDLIGRDVMLYTVDADTAFSLTDAAGRPLWACNPQGTHTSFLFEAPDCGGRIVAVIETAPNGEPRTREQFTWGTSDSPHLRARNLIGTVVRHCDNIGLTDTLSRTLSGQPRLTAQQLLRPDAPPADWPADLSSQLEPPLHVRTKYDATGATLTLTSSADVTTLNCYDVCGELYETRLYWMADGVQQQAITLRDIVRMADGRVLTQTTGNGITEEYSYDPQTLRLNRYRVRRTAEHLLGAFSITDLCYTYDPAGNPLHIGDRAYVYDTLYRLSSASGRERLPASRRDGPFPAKRADNSAGGRWSSYTQHYAYDDGDNLLETVHIGAVQRWTRRSCIAKHSNRGIIEKVPMQTDPHDAYFPGGLQRHLDDGRSLVWHPDGQLAMVSSVQRTRVDVDNDTETYRYADTGTRVYKLRTTQAAGGTLTLLTTYAAGCETRRRYGPGGHKLLDVVISEAGKVRLAKNLLSGEIHLRYAFSDPHAGSGGETDTAGRVTAWEKYYPYGGSAGSLEELTEVADRTHRYAGKEQDATGLYYYGYRYYQPGCGRWLSADPGGLIDGLNLFRFCKNAPLTYKDNDGRDPLLIFGGAAIISATAVIAGAIGMMSERNTTNTTLLLAGLSMWLISLVASVRLYLHENVLNEQLKFGMSAAKRAYISSLQKGLPEEQAKEWALMVRPVAESCYEEGFCFEIRKKDSGGFIAYVGPESERERVTHILDNIQKPMRSLRLLRGRAHQFPAMINPESTPSAPSGEINFHAEYAEGVSSAMRLAGRSRTNQVDSVVEEPSTSRMASSVESVLEVNDAWLDTPKAMKMLGEDGIQQARKTVERVREKRYKAVNWHPHQDNLYSADITGTLSDRRRGSQRLMFSLEKNVYRVTGVRDPH